MYRSMECPFLVIHWSTDVFVGTIVVLDAHLCLGSGTRSNRTSYGKDQRLSRGAKGAKRGTGFDFFTFPSDFMIYLIFLLVSCFIISWNGLLFISHFQLVLVFLH